VDEQWPEDLPTRRQAIYLLSKLASASRKFPSSLFVVGVDIGTSRDPLAQGGFADVFRGMYGDQTVALKRPRTTVAAKTDYHRVSISMCTSHCRMVDEQNLFIGGMQGGTNMAPT
jgi:hypothetical protein